MKVIYAVIDHNPDSGEPVHFSIWTSSRRALEALARYRKKGFISDKGEVVTLPLNQDAFPR